MKSSARWSKRIGAAFAFALAFALIAALPVFASADEKDDTKELDGSDVELTAQALTNEQKASFQSWLDRAQQAMADVKASNDGSGLADGTVYVQVDTYNILAGNISEVEKVIAGTSESANPDQYLRDLEGYLQAFNAAKVTKSSENGQQNQNVSQGRLSLSIQDRKEYEVTGSPIRPNNIVVNYSDGGAPRQLTENTEYVLSFKNNATSEISEAAPSAEGTYTVIATGINGTPYAGLKTDENDKGATFTIYSATSFSSTKCVVDANPSLYDYTGKPIAPTVTVWWEGTALVEGTDYTLGYEDKSGKALNGLPTEVGKYNVRATGIGKYSGSKVDEFEIAVPNSLANPACQATIERKAYAYTGQAIKPAIVVTFNDIPLVEGRDYYIAGYQKRGDKMSWTDVAAPVEMGSYRPVIKAVEGGAYSGEMDRNANAQLEFSIVENGNNNPALWTVNFANRDFSSTDSPVVSLTGTKATPPEVVVTDPSGTALKEGKDYRLDYYGPDTKNFAAEGQYNITVFAISADQHYNGQRVGELSFCVAKPEHDLTKATVAMPDTFDYEGGADIKDKVGKSISVTLAGKTLKLDQDFQASYNRKTGTLGAHAVLLVGNALKKDRSYNADGQRGENGQQGQQQLNQEQYYGHVRLSYGVWNDAAPAADKRVDLATGVSATGSVISEKSTYEGEKWVTLTAASLAGNAVDAQAQTAVSTANAAGAQDVRVFDVKLDQVVSTGVADNSEGLTANLGDLTLSFPVDAKYNGMTATVTQIHDGKAMDPKTVTIEGGQVPVATDRLSQFVVSVDPNSATDDKAADTKAAGSKAAKASTAKTGDALPVQVVVTIAIIALVVASVLLVARRLSRR